VDLFEPVVVRPKMIVFPLGPTNSYTYQLCAKGGSDAYVWTIADKHLGVIHESDGTLTTALVAQGGECSVIVTDAKQTQLGDWAKVGGKIN
jgi:hypothetical protein